MSAVGGSCRNGHDRTERNTVTRNGIRVCLDCQLDRNRDAQKRAWTRQKSAVAQPATKRKKTRPRPAAARTAGDQISAAEASRRVVQDGTPVALAARWAGKSNRVVKDGAWTLVKREVRRRDGSTCWRCRKQGDGLDVHHRKPKQMGGAGTATEFGLANLVSLCRDCHSWVHANPSEAMLTGLLLSQSSTPEREPITVAGRTRWLTSTGRITTTQEWEGEDEQ